MTIRYGVDLHPDSVRWAANERVSEDVIAAVLLLHERSVDEIAPKLSPAELEQVIVLVGRSPRLYARGLLEALEQRRRVLAPTPSVASTMAAKQGAGAPEIAGHSLGRDKLPFRIRPAGPARASEKLRSIADAFRAENRPKRPKGQQNL
jgi:hypothetical protein